MDIELLALRNRTERATDIYQEIGRLTDEPEIKEAIEARAFASSPILADRRI